MRQITPHHNQNFTADLSDRETVQIDDFYLNRLRPGERAVVLRRLSTAE